MSPFTVYGAPRGDAKLDELETAVNAEIENIIENGVTDRELESAKKRFVRSMIFARDDQDSMANLYGSSLATGETVEDIAEWPDRIKAVTAEQVQRAAAKYLSAAHSVTGYLLPSEPVQN